jgi:nitrogen fixation/metabolism regulation signal transduction histidine kinase
VKRARTIALLALAALVAVGALVALSLSVENSAQFQRLQPVVLLASAVAVLVLSVLIARKLVQLVAARRRGDPGSRLTARTAAVSGALVALPLVTVYLFSLGFLNRGIDSWFRDEVKQGLNDSASLSRSVRDLLLREHGEIAERFAERLAGMPSGQMLVELDREFAASGANEIVIYGEHERILGVASRSVSDALPARPPAELVRRIADGATYVSFEPLAGSNYLIRAAAPVPGGMLGPQDARFVVATYDPPSRFAELTEAVDRSRSTYADVEALREPLKYSFSVTLTLVLLVTLLGAIYAAIFSAELLFKPVQDLMAGTRAVARGDLETRVPPSSDDEMGSLVDSFNDMTQGLRRAREENAASRLAVERERERLALILGRLSSGVLAVDRALVLRLANAAAGHILGVDFAGREGQPLDAIEGTDPRLREFVAALRERLDAGREEWREQLELSADGAAPARVLACACVPLPQGGEPGFVVVLEDVTHLLQAQRDAAWGEVARRLAHEIRNPLTPIQLSAERLRLRLLPGLTGQDAEIVERSTHTIVQQVESMKQMVNDFSEYARAPAVRVAPFDLNQLVTEVADLYRAQEAAIPIVVELDPATERIEADRGRVRQVLNNLLTNALEALEGVRPAAIELRTRLVEEGGAPAAVVTVTDNGPGFQPEMLGRVFDPYVTSKPRGTGLGLAIVKKIIEDHGGRIEAENRPEGGARVRVMLPLREGARGQALSERRSDLRRERA